MIQIAAEGEGMKVSGYVAHPSSHQTKTSHQYTLINRRPIWDNGITKSIHLGFGRFIPQGQKIPFVISIEIRPDLLDVNVHPRKEEVKFINPFRVYSIVENAVSKALSEGTKLEQSSSAINYSQRHHEAPGNTLMFDSSSYRYENKPKEINFAKKKRDFNIGTSLEFSKEALKNMAEQSDVRNAFQIFNKYIVLEFEDELWMIDQHAAAERITFERLEQNYESTPAGIQALLVPAEITAGEAEASFVSENIDFFKKLGFDIEVGEGKVLVRSTPAYFQQADIVKIFREIWELSDEQRDMKDSFDKAKGHILATMSCHSSIRTGQGLSKQECLQVYRELKECKNPYSCPHGRPIVWKMILSEIDKNFDRTY
jgi:DNA mismatch repair protein MutL